MQQHTSMHTISSQKCVLREAMRVFVAARSMQSAKIYVLCTRLLIILRHRRAAPLNSAPCPSLAAKNKVFSLPATAYHLGGDSCRLWDDPTNDADLTYRLNRRCLVMRSTFAALLVRTCTPSSGCFDPRSRTVWCGLFVSTSRTAPIPEAYRTPTA